MLCKLARPSSPALRLLCALRFYSPSSTIAHLYPSASSSHRTSSRMALSSHTVEHVVLFIVKPDTGRAQSDAMVSDLRKLSSLDTVLHLTAGPLMSTRSSPFNITHLLHSRYKTKSDLATYVKDPFHLSVVRDSVISSCEDIIAIDWMADLGDGPILLNPGSVMRLTFLKPKEDAKTEEKLEIVDVFRGLKDLFPELIYQISAGENFSPERAKGYELACVWVFTERKALEALDAEDAKVKSHIGKVGHLVESTVEVDYCIS